MKKSLFISLISIIFVNICITPVSYGWVLRGSNDTFIDAAYGNNIYIVVGIKGVIYRSVDNTVTWSKINSNSVNIPNGLTCSVTFGSSRFVAVWDSGIIRTSKDGISWDEIIIDGKPSFLQVIYGNNKFVAVSYSDVYISDDGLKWIKAQSLPGNTYSIAYGNGKFVILGQYGKTPTYVSVDGENWTEVHGIDEGGYSQCSKVLFDGKKFIVSTYRQVFNSVDGVSWAVLSTSQGASPYDNIAYGNNKFLKTSYALTPVSVGGINYMPSVPTILTSSDLKTWDEVFRLSKNTYFKNVVYVNKLFIALGTGMIITSPDAKNWYTGLFPVNQDLYKIKFSSSQFIAIGKGTRNVVNSSDGKVWKATDMILQSPYAAMNRFFDIAYGNNQQIAVGEKGEIFASQDGASWAQVNSGTDKWLDSVLYINELNAWVIAGWGGTILTSLNNGSTWNKKSVPTEYPLLGIAHGNGQIVMIGANGVVITSKDGNNAWNRGYIGNDNWYYDITYGRGMFVAVGDNGKIMTSQDGSKWVEEVSNSVNQLNSIIFSNNQFYVVGNKGTLLTSYNGIIWKSEQLPIVENINSIAYDNTSRQFVLVGDNGAILTTK